MITNAIHTAARTPASAPPSAAAPSLCAARPPGHGWNTRGTFTSVLSASFSPSHAALTTNSSPLAAPAIAEMLRVLTLVLQLLENPAELAGDLELVTSVNRILARWTSRSSAVTKRCTAHICSLSSLATRNGPVRVLKSLRRLPCCLLYTSPSPRD